MIACLRLILPFDSPKERRGALERKRKIELSKKLSEKLKRAKAMFATDYSGLTVGEMESTRNSIKSLNATFNVIKNNVVKKAIEGSEWEKVSDSVVGPNAFAITSEDPVALAKVLVEKAKEHKKLEIKFGVLDGKIIDAKQVKQLSKTPSKEVLLSMLLSTFNAPATGFVNVLAGNVRKLMYTLKAIEEKKKENA